nr:hypothetical protein [Devosia aurantiaca]
MTAEEALERAASRAHADNGNFGGGEEGSQRAQNAADELDADSVFAKLKSLKGNSDDE